MLGSALLDEVIPKNKRYRCCREFFCNPENELGPLFP